jgi:hypothetical protein
MKFLEKLIDFFVQKPAWQYFLVGLASLAWFGFLQLDYSFADPDAFYHAKMPLMIVEQGASTTFPWLSATTLAYSYTNHHFLFHLLLIPFVLISPLIGLKVATVVFSSLAVLTFFWLLRRLNVVGAFWYTFLLLASDPFVFRLSLAKSQAIVLILLFLLLYCIIHRKYLALILLSCLYVWVYAGWPLALVVVTLYSIISAVWFLLKSPNIFKKIGNLKVLSQSYLAFISVVVGLTCGIFFSPYFPGNLGFYWQQTFQIALVNYQHLIGVGGEWYPMGLTEWFLQSPFFILFSLIAFIFFIVTAKKQSVQSWFLLAVGFLFFILTIKSRRYIEYAVPMILLFDAASFSVVWRIIKQDFKAIYQSKVARLALVVLLLLGTSASVYEASMVVGSLRGGFAFDSFKGPADWLKGNSNQGDIVFHTDWDIFPMLFYYNHKNYYLVGLDPTFMYLNDSDLYKRWIDVVDSKQSENNNYQVINELFNAKFVLVKLEGHEVFDERLSRDSRFELKYSDSETKVYQVIK